MSLDKQPGHLISSFNTFVETVRGGIHSCMPPTESHGLYGIYLRPTSFAREDDSIEDSSPETNGIITSLKDKYKDMSALFPALLPVLSKPKCYRTAVGMFGRYLFSNMSKFQHNGLSRKETEAD